MKTKHQDLFALEDMAQTKHAISRVEHVISEQWTVPFPNHAERTLTNSPTGIFLTLAFIIFVIRPPKGRASIILGTTWVQK
jgi:hypothetical protein